MKQPFKEEYAIDLGQHIIQVIKFSTGSKYKVVVEELARISCFSIIHLQTPV